jgi:hypothetical protein
MFIVFEIDDRIEVRSDKEFDLSNKCIVEPGFRFPAFEKTKQGTAVRIANDFPLSYNPLRPQKPV